MAYSVVEIKKCLASYSIFREIYDREKDIYDILSIFIVDSIRVAGKHQFSSIEVVDLLNGRFSFSIPDAVVKNALKRIRGIRRSENIYSLGTVPTSFDELDQRLEETERKNEAVLERLFTTIEERYERKLSLGEREESTQAFAKFLLDKDSALSRYSKIISGFVIKHSDDAEFVKALSLIKEGLLLYSGLQYTPEEFSSLKWDHDLFLFLDTDVLFSIVGLNGDLKKTLALELINLVREVNSKAQKAEKRNRIEIRYFKEIEQEVIDFYSAAEHKVAQSQREIEKRPAMIAIMDGCKTKSDVVSKRNIFFSTLKALGILKDEYDDYFTEENHKYYIESEESAREVITALAITWEINDVRYCLTLLSKVNILRKDRKPRFEDAKYFLVTGNGMYHEVGKYIARARSHDTQLDTSVEVLTDKLWVKLNKGFGKDSVPKAFSIIAKAQIVLSSQLNISVGAKFAELEEKVKKQEISLEAAQLSLSDFRQRVLPAERINSSNVDEMLEFTEQSVQDTVQEYEFARIRFEAQAAETIKLRRDLDEKGRRLDTLEVAENARRHRANSWKRFARGLLLLGAPACLWVGGVVLLIIRQPDFISISLGSVGLLTQIMGALRFFGIDAEKIGAFLKR